MFNYQQRMQSLMAAQQELNTAVARDFEVRGFASRKLVVEANLRKAEELHSEALAEVQEYNKMIRDTTQVEFESAMSNVDTYNGWKQRGFQVCKGEKATKIDAISYFHFTQTTGFGL